MKKLFHNIWITSKRGIVNAFKNHKWALLGWISTWIVPLVSIMTYLGLETSKTTKITFEPWIIIVLIVMLIIYYKKVKSTMRIKLQTSKAIGKVANPLWYILNGLASVIVIAVVYWVVKIMTTFNLDNLLVFLVICMASVGFGALCYAIDAVNALAREQESIKKEEPANVVNN